MEVLKNFVLVPIKIKNSGKDMKKNFGVLTKNFGVRTVFSKNVPLVEFLIV